MINSTEKTNSDYAGALRPRLVGPAKTDALLGSPITIIFHVEVQQLFDFGAYAIAEASFHHTSLKEAREAF